MALSPSSSDSYLCSNPASPALDLDLDGRHLLPHHQPQDPLPSERSHPPPRYRRCLFSPPASSGSFLPPPPPITKKGRKRGTYNCGKCGLPKRGHICIDDSPETQLPPRWTPLPPDPSSPDVPGCLQQQRHQHHADEAGVKQDEDSASFLSTGLAPRTPQGVLDRLHKRDLAVASMRLRQASNGSFRGHPRPSSSPSSTCSSNERYRRAMAASRVLEASGDADCVSADSNGELEAKTRRQDTMPLACMVRILSQLSPPDLVAASSVCRRWRQCSEYVWAAIREANFSISAPDIGSKASRNEHIPFFLRKCSNLRRLSLNVSSQISDYFLRCVATLSPQLSSLEVSLKEGGVNTVSGDGVRALFQRCKSLTSLKLEGCRNIYELELNSAQLQVFWLTGCDQLKYVLLNCPTLSELSLDFLPHGSIDLGSQISDENTDHLAAIMKNLGNSARGLKRLHVASPWLHDRVVLALLSSGLRLLRMLSLTFGSGITDKSVAAIASSCENLELLDLSGSSISDKALELIFKSFSNSVTKLLVALCPKISQVGLQTAVSQLPFLQVLDCGRVIIDDCTSRDECFRDGEQYFDGDSKEAVVTQLHSHSGSSTFRVLSLQHSRLEKLSLWGCSGLQVLMLDCPELVELNLTGCSKLKPEKLKLLCPALRDVYVGKCEESLLQVIQCQVEQAVLDHDFPVSVFRQADGSKRVQAPRITRKI